MIHIQDSDSHAPVATEVVAGQVDVVHRDGGNIIDRHKTSRVTSWCPKISPSPSGFSICWVSCISAVASGFFPHTENRTIFEFGPLFLWAIFSILVELLEGNDPRLGGPPIVRVPQNWAVTAQRHVWWINFTSYLNSIPQGSMPRTLINLFQNIEAIWFSRIHEYESMIYRVT